MKWITRERPKIDREPEFLYVPTGEVLQVAAKNRCDTFRYTRR